MYERLKIVKRKLKFNVPVSIEPQHAGWFMVAMLLAITGSFVTGYFFGLKKSADTIDKLISRDSR